MFYGNNRHPESSRTWIGLIDGLYGINITFMLVGAPDYLSELIRAHSAGTISNTLSMKLAFEYLFFLVIVALISFDLWGLHSLSVRSDYILRKKASMLNLLGLGCNAAITLCFQISMIRKLDVAQSTKIFMGTSLLDLLVLVSLATAYASHIFILRNARHAHSSKRGSELSSIKVRDASVHAIKSATILAGCFILCVVHIKMGLSALALGICYIYIIDDIIKSRKSIE